MYETLLRPFDVSTIPTPLPVGVASDRLKKAEVKREEKRLLQIAQGSRNKQPNGSDTQGSKRKRGDTTPVEVDAPAETKRPKVAAEGGDIELDETQMDTAAAELAIAGPSTSATPTARSSLPPTSKISAARVLPEVRGHTSYLTFATLLPVHPDLQSPPGQPAHADGEQPPIPEPEPDQPMETS